MAEGEHIENREEIYNVPGGPREIGPARRISWGAVWGGVMVAIGAEALLTFFGLFIGFVAFNPVTRGGGGFTAWSWAWFWVTSFLALYAGGWSAARLMSNDQPQSGSMHGLVTWGLTTLWTVGFILWATWGAVVNFMRVMQGAVTEAAVPRGVAPPALPVSVAASFGQAVWALALLVWIGLSIGAAASWIGGKKGERAVRAQG